MPLLLALLTKVVGWILSVDGSNHSQFLSANAHDSRVESSRRRASSVPRGQHTNHPPKTGAWNRWDDITDWLGAILTKECARQTCTGAYNECQLGKTAVGVSVCCWSECQRREVTILLYMWSITMPRRRQARDVPWQVTAAGKTLAGNSHTTTHCCCIFFPDSFMTTPPQPAGFACCRIDGSMQCVTCACDAKREILTGLCNLQLMPI